MIVIIIALELSLSVNITSVGDPTEGQNYSLTCAIKSAEFLTSSKVEYMYGWHKNGDSSTLSSFPTLNFTSLNRSDNGSYTCTVTINSTLLNNTIMAMNGSILTVTRKLVSYVDLQLLII